MPPGTLTKQARKLTEKIDGNDVFVTDLVNDDLDNLDEMFDEYAELERQISEISAKLAGEDDAGERAKMRAQTRALKHDQRAVDLSMLGLYTEDTDGNDFPVEVLAKVPVRVQTSLTRQATKLIYGSDDEGPTPGSSDAR